MIITISLFVLALLLIVLILLQSRGAGLGQVFGGSGGVYLVKRGIEKKLFIATIIVSILFFGLALIAVFVK